MEDLPIAPHHCVERVAVSYIHKKIIKYVLILEIKKRLEIAVYLITFN